MGQIYWPGVEAHPSLEPWDTRPQEQLVVGHATSHLCWKLEPLSLRSTGNSLFLLKYKYQCGREMTKERD